MGRILPERPEGVREARRGEEVGSRIERLHRNGDDDDAEILQARAGLGLLRRWRSAAAKPDRQHSLAGPERQIVQHGAMEITKDSGLFTAVRD